MVSNTNATTPAVRPPPEMPPFDRKRRSLMHLRPRHLLWVEELGIREHYDRSDMHGYMVEHYNSLFGPLRRNEVPSDQFRKSWMIGILLDLVDGRRAEYAEERAYHQSRS